MEWEKAQGGGDNAADVKEADGGVAVDSVDPRDRPQAADGERAVDLTAAALTCQPVLPVFLVFPVFPAVEATSTAEQRVHRREKQQEPVRPENSSSAHRVEVKLLIFYTCVLLITRFLPRCAYVVLHYLVSSSR